jgi:hypothetical protein
MRYPTQMQLEVGTQIDRYIVGAPIAEGILGQVFPAPKTANSASRGPLGDPDTDTDTDTDVDTPEDPTRDRTPRTGSGDPAAGGDKGRFSFKRSSPRRFRAPMTTPAAGW